MRRCVEIGAKKAIEGQIWRSASGLKRMLQVRARRGRF
jgi:hypothetical protein